MPDNRTRKARIIGVARRYKTPVFVFCLPLIIVFLATRAFENLLSAQRVKWLETCLQFVTGDWPSSDGILDHTTWGFALVVTFKTALIYAALVGLVKIWRDLVAWRKEEMIMKYSELLHDRDDSIENELRAVLKNVPDEQGRAQLEDFIHQAFERGAKVWAEQYLPILAGSDEKAKEILAKLEREQILA